jgi:hypothetical protein
MKLDRWLLAAAAGVAGLVVTGSFGPANAQDGRVGARSLRGAAPTRAHVGRGNPDSGRGLDRRGTNAGVGVNVDVPLTYDAYASGGLSCRSLRMRAEVTGSGYWWDRYRGCLDGRDD